MHPMICLTTKILNACKSRLAGDSGSLFRDRLSASDRPTSAADVTNAISNFQASDQRQSQELYWPIALAHTCRVSEHFLVRYLKLNNLHRHTVAELPTLAFHYCQAGHTLSRLQRHVLRAFPLSIRPHIAHKRYFFLSSTQLWHCVAFGSKGLATGPCPRKLADGMAIICPSHILDFKFDTRKDWRGSQSHSSKVRLVFLVLR